MIEKDARPEAERYVIDVQHIRLLARRGREGKGGMRKDGNQIMAGSRERSP
jgi:hypothetical protein